MNSVSYLNTHLRCASVIVAAATQIFMLTGCSRIDESGKTPDTFVFARGSDAQKLDPADIDDGESVNTLAQICEGLVRFKSGTLDIQPWLARSYTISKDGLTYTFELREGVRFHDGTPLNAETALFTFERQLDTTHPAHFLKASFQYWKNLFQEIKTVRATGPMTIEFELSEPNASVLYSLATFPAWLISPLAFESHGEAMVRRPIGTGPYRFVDWKPNQAIILEKNQDYWGSEAGFERLVMRTIPDNTVRLLELKAGKIHALDGLQPAELAELFDHEKFTIHAQPGMNVGYMAFSNYAARLRPPAIRLAIAMAIDRKAIVDLALDGFAIVAEYPIPPGFLGEPDNSQPPIIHDPDAARKILNEYPDLLKRPIELHTFTAPRPYFPDPLKIASLIRNDLENVNLKVEIITRDFKSHLVAARRGNFELALLGWSGDNGDPDNFLATFFASWAAVADSATNISFYKNEAMDNLLIAGRQQTDLNQRQKTYEQALVIWARDLPLIPLIHTEQIVVTRSEVTGFQLQKTANLFFGPVGWQSL